MCYYPLMCIQEGSDMGSRIRGLGTSESWFNLGVALDVWEPASTGLVLYTDSIQGNSVFNTLMEVNTYFGWFCVSFT
jgi:hypothetical protein